MHAWEILYEYMESEPFTTFWYGILKTESESIARMIRGCSVVTSIAEKNFLSGKEIITNAKH